MKQMAKLAVAIGLGLALISGASSPSMARSASANAGDRYYEPGDNGSAWAYYPGYEDNVRGAHARATAPVARNRSPEWNGSGTHYYEGDDNGSVWSYYQGYRPLR